MTEQISLEEQEKILILADALLAEEESWRKGTWKCPLPQFKNGKPVYDDYGRIKQKTDANGREMYQYCIEGAINQATVDVVGPERAARLGAVRLGPGGGVVSWEGSQDGRATPTGRMGLDKITLDLYGQEMGYSPEVIDQYRRKNQHGVAMSYNDGVGSYEGVKNIIRTGLSRVQERLAKRKGK